jgi:lipopolysaccharide transport system permease protein
MSLVKDMGSEEDWDLTISPSKSLLSIDISTIWRYRDLLLLFVRRDFVATYKQTILGPLWFFIQPIFTTLIFTIVFGNIAQISTSGMPKTLFYLSGITIWNYFSDCVTKTSNTFVTNQGVFGKVYFPRIIVPLSIIVTNLLKFGVQMILFMGFYIYYMITTDVVQPNSWILLFPILVISMAAMSLGLGMIISSLTTKYRDLSFLITFGVQLMMYASPIIYPISSVPNKYQLFIELNPMTGIINNFKFGCLGIGELDTAGLIYSSSFAIVTILLGTVIFNKVEKSFIDTV